MEFLLAVIRDDLIYTIPFIFARIILYPIVNLNNRMQKQYQKIEEEADMKERFQKYQNFSFSEKFQGMKELIKYGGIKGMYEKFENYLVPFTMGRAVEGFVYFAFMRFCLDILKLEDPLYLLTGLSFFFVSLIGAFTLKIWGDIMRERKGFKDTLNHISPSNKNFWKQYEIELGYYHAYGLIQGYTQLITFWYFKPGFVLEIILFTASRFLAALNCQPLALLSQWASDHEYDHVKLFQHISKKYGRRGLYAGARDMLINEFLISIILVPGFHIMAKLI
jgi:hypothetical protein